MTTVSLRSATLIASLFICLSVHAGPAPTPPLAGVPAGAGADFDDDSIPDASDNCIEVFNPDQRDTDADGFGNFCDPDFNNDGIVNFVDMGILKAGMFGTDPNLDLNGDGKVNSIDVGTLRDLFFQPPGPSATPAQQPIWQLVWLDDFDGVMLNPANWSARTDADCPDPCSGVQSYQTERVSVGAGLLTIEAREDAARGGSPITSGLIDTRSKREIRHGRIEIDVKMPTGTDGVMPSLWMLPGTGQYGAWPQSGEINIANALDIGTMLEHTLRYGLSEPEDTTATATSVGLSTASTEFITYALEWEAGEIRWFVDGVHVATQVQNNWYAYSEDANGVFTLGTGAAPFDENFYLLIGLAVETPGGTYPQNLQVDAVRIYECANADDPDAGTGCAGLIDAVDPGIVPVVATPPPHNSVPYTETLNVYTDAPATLDFIDEGGMITAGTLVPDAAADPGVLVTSIVDADDGGNTVWNVGIDAPVGTGGVFMRAGDFASAVGSFDLSGGATAGEVLFRMRVNSSTGDPQLTVGLNSDTGTGAQQLMYVADGIWRNYSVKIEDLVIDSIIQGASLDIASLTNLFRLEATGGSLNLGVDDISVKVACRDIGRCEATPRLVGAPDTVYVQSFELPDIDIADTMTLANDGWLVFGNVFDSGGNYLFGYGAFPAPNDPPPAGFLFFSAIVTGQGGTSQGDQQLSIFSDYNCCQPSNGHFNGTDRVESLVFQELTLTAADVGKTYTFSFDAKADSSGFGLSGASTALAFIKTLDPSAGFSQTSFAGVDTTSLPDTWQRYEASLEIDADLVGQLLQFGFACTASDFEPSNVFYDNVLLTRAQ